MSKKYYLLLGGYPGLSSYDTVSEAASDALAIIKHTGGTVQPLICDEYEARAIRESYRLPHIPDLPEPKRYSD